MTERIPADAEKRGKKLILIIEDDTMMSEMYRRKLEKSGFEVLVGANGEEGLVALERMRPNLILLDIMMPKLSGLDVLKTIKRNPAYADLPVVILTNLGDRAQDMQKCKEMGAADYWVKANLKMDDLIEKITELLRSGEKAAS